MKDQSQFQSIIAQNLRWTVLVICIEYESFDLDVKSIVMVIVNCIFTMRGWGCTLKIKPFQHFADSPMAFVSACTFKKLFAHLFIATGL